MNSNHEGGAIKEPSESAQNIDISLTEDDNGNFVVFSLNSDCQIKLTLEEARSLAIRLIMATNRAETRSNLMQSSVNLSRKAQAATKVGWFHQAFAK